MESWFSKGEDRRSLPNAIKAARRISLKTAMGYIPLGVVGFWAFGASGLTLLEVRSGLASARGVN